MKRQERFGSRLGQIHGSHIIIGFMVAVLMLASSVVAAKIDVSQHFVAAEDNGRYDRNPSLTVFDGEYWLFYTKGDDGSTGGVRTPGYNPDNDSYVIWYKRGFQTPEEVTTAPEIMLDLSATDRPVGFDQRDVSALVFNNNLYVFASAGFGGSAQPIYYYKWDGSSWSGPTMLNTGGGGHAYAVADADRVYITLEKGVPDTMRSVVYTWDGPNFNGPFTVAAGNGVPKITLRGGTLFVVSIAPTATTVNLHTCPAGATPSTWTYLSDPVSVADSYVWDPSIASSGPNLIVLAAPSTAAPDRQWIVQTHSTDNGATWSPVKNVSTGGVGSIYWWDYWPTLWPNGYGGGVITFTTEGFNGTYADGMIGVIGIDWNLDNNHSFYIQQAINVAAAGDTVTVGKGTFRGAGNRDLDFAGKPLLLQSANGPDTAIIDCEGSLAEPHHGIYFHSGEDSTSIIHGFKIMNAHSDSGAIGCFASAPIIRGCIVENTTGAGVYAVNADGLRLEYNNIRNNDGRGVVLKSGSATVRGCIVQNNGSHGLSIRDSQISIDNSDFIENDSSGIWDDSFNTRLSVTNSLMAGNADFGLYINNWGGLFTVTNCTIVSNETGLGYDFEMPKDQSADRSDSSIISNCVVAFNQGRGIARLWLDQPVFGGSCNDAYGNPGGDYVGTPFWAGDTNGNISLDPLFCERLNGNYYLSSTSPSAPANNSCGVLMGKYGIGCSLPYLCGDANQDGMVNITDAVFLVVYIFSGGPAPFPLAAGDVDCNGMINISDAVYLLAYIFGGGAAPCANCP